MRGGTRHALESCPMWNGKTVSIIFPTYNEKDSIRAAVEDFLASGYVDEVVVVNNNAAEGTDEEVRKTAARLIHEPMQGYGHALWRGMDECTGDLIILAEPDGTFSGGDVIKLLAFAQDVPVVFGTRTAREFVWEGANMGIFLKWGNYAVGKLMEFLFNTTFLSDVGCTMKLLHRSVYEHIRPQFTVGGSAFGPQLMMLCILNGYPFVEIPVNYRSRVGESSVTGSKVKAFFLGCSMINMILRYRVLSWIGRLPNVPTRHIHRLLVLGALLASGAFAAESKPETANFADGVHHYQNAADKTEYPRYTPEQVDEIAQNILLFQRDNGGWSSNWDPLRILGPEEAARIPSQRPNLDTTLDNRASYPQTEYLASAFNLTQNAAYRDAAIRGLQFLLKAQHPSGAWPHSWPDTKNYRPHLTFMDDVTVGTLTTVRKAARGEAPFTFLPQELRDQLAEATRRGEAALLKLQVVVDGTPTVWAGQYDEKTLEPTNARPFELVSLVSAESVNVVRYLMSIENPNPEVTRAIEAAIAWFKAATIHGLRVERVKIAPTRFPNHTATVDVVATPDPAAPPTWARFYEIGTNRPFMANRDGKKVYSLAEVALERRTGYAWYTRAPAPLLDDEYPRWNAEHPATP